MLNHTYQLTDKQLDRLSEFTANTGLIPLVPAVAQLFSEAEALDWFTVSTALTSSFVCVIISLSLVKNLKYDH